MLVRGSVLNRRKLKFNLKAKVVEDSIYFNSLLYLQQYAYLQNTSTNLLTLEEAYFPKFSLTSSSISYSYFPRRRVLFNNEGYKPLFASDATFFTRRSNMATVSNEYNIGNKGL